VKGDTPQVKIESNGMLPPPRSGGRLERGHSSPFTLHSSPDAERIGGPQGRRLDPRRWHFQHGPIDLIIGADGDDIAIETALGAAWARFGTILSELVAELALLRAPIDEAQAVRGVVARRMVAACNPHRDEFITPMAAVAGAVADELIECFRAEPRITRAYVNNGGDIALHLSPGHSFKIGVLADVGSIDRRKTPALDAQLEIGYDLPVRGIATSGWRGRSFSLGIADSVTVLASCAAAADAAATMVANSVNADDPAVVRRPGCELKDDTDLGARLVTVAVGPLAPETVDRALASGVGRASGLIARGLIHCTALWLQGRVRLVGV
jgi:uncharacterized protein